MYSVRVVLCIVYCRLGICLLVDFDGCWVGFCVFTCFARFLARCG